MTRLMTAVFIFGVLLLGVGAWLISPAVSLLLVGAVCVLLPLLYVRGGWVA